MRNIAAKHNPLADVENSGQIALDADFSFSGSWSAGGNRTSFVYLRALCGCRLEG